MSANEDSSRMLRGAFRANAVFSALSGIAMFVADGLIAALLGHPGATDLLHLVGGGLVLFSAYLFFLASRASIRRADVLMVIAGDLAWVVGSWIAIGAGVFSSQGNWAAGIVADVVLLFAILQYVGLRRVDRAGTAPQPA